MGRKLNLTHLSDQECRKILDVIQRDFRVRHDEKERFTNLQKYVYEEAQKRMVLSRQQKFNEKHCICCFSSFGFILNRKIQCQVCQFFICKNCRAKSEKKEDILCIACIQQQELQVRACESVLCPDQSTIPTIRQCQSCTLSLQERFQKDAT
eukprot:XP_011672051.1 PREDICTED: rab effector MyRIP-like [Strongylocentrotus purpuratus]